MNNAITEYYENMDWGNLTIEEQCIHSTERAIALGTPREEALIRHGAMVEMLIANGLSNGEGLEASNVRDYDAIMQDILGNAQQTGTSVQEDIAVETPVLPVNTEESNPVRTEPFIDLGELAFAEQTTIRNTPEDTSGLTTPMFEFDETNGAGEVEEDHIQINRRGSQEPVSPTPTNHREPLDVNNGSGFDMQQVLGNLLGAGVSEEGSSTTVRGRDIEDEDKAHVEADMAMLSYFSLFPVDSVQQSRRDARGNTHLDYAIMILISYEEPDENGGTGDAVVAPTIEEAIQYLGEQGYQYNKSKNIFSMEMNNGSRRYARIIMDADLRGVLG